MAMLNNIYVFEENDNKEIYLHLDGTLRLIDTTSFLALYGDPLENFQYNTINSRSQFPYSVGRPISSQAGLYTASVDPDATFFIDEVPWFEDRLVFRKIVNSTQLLQLGFRTAPSAWPTTMLEIAVPLAIDSGKNWHLQTFFSGYHLCYNHICHPEFPMNPYFALWLDNNFTKAHLKRLIIHTQMQISRLAGEEHVAAPVFEPEEGVYNSESLTVRISSATRNASIYYTTDGSDPFPGVSSTYTRPVTFNIDGDDGATLKAIAEYHDSIGISSITSGDYSFMPINVDDPVFSPANREQLQTSVQVTITCDTENVSIYYTLDSSRPNSSSTRYDGNPVTLDLSEGSVTIKAIAIHDDLSGESDIMTATYDWAPPRLKDPTFSPISENRVGPNIFVTVNQNQAETIVRYATGIRATQPETQYTDPVEMYLAGKTDLKDKIIAQATGLDSRIPPSEIVSKTYHTENSWLHVWELYDDAADSVGAIELGGKDVTYVEPETVTDYPAAVFNGSSSILKTSKVSTLHSANFTICAWAKLTAMPASGKLAPIWAFEKTSDGFNGPAVFVHSSGKVQGQTVKNISNLKDAYVKCFSSDGYVQTENWYQFVLVAERTSLNLYINGALIQSVDFDGSLNTDYCERFLIGAELSGGNEPSTRNGISAHINRVYYFGLPLNADSVSRLYQEERIVNP